MRWLVVFLCVFAPAWAHDPEDVAPAGGTTATLHVEAGRLSIDFAIGSSDSAAFRNLLPDDLYRALDLPPEPHVERLKKFANNDFVVRGDGEVLTGVPGAFHLDSGKNASVVKVRVDYATPVPPTTITIQPPPIGRIRTRSFHANIPVHHPRVFDELF